jgi:hypothetical protein
MLFDCFISCLYMRVLKLTLGKNIFLLIFPQVSVFQCEVFGRTYSYVQTRAVLPYADLADAHPDRISIGLRLASLSLPYTHLFAFLWHVVCFSRGFLPRFWHSLFISSHPMIFLVSSVILLSFCTFRILEYLLGYFLEIVCMKILFCLCVGLIVIYLSHLDCDLCFCNSWASN